MNEPKYKIGQTVYCLDARNLRVSEFFIIGIETRVDPRHLVVERKLSESYDLIFRYIAFRDYFEECDLYETAEDCKNAYILQITEVLNKHITEVLNKTDDN